MTEKSKSNKFVQFLKVIQDYWFLISLLFSALAALFYFIYFDVNPLEKQYENKMQSLHAGLHNNIGLSFLQQGYFEKAKKEYDGALEYKPYSRDALNGKLLSELFLSLGSVDRNPALAGKIKTEVSKLEFSKEDELFNIREKYFADLELHNGDIKEAMKLYNNLLVADSNYIDLLNTYAWLNYEIGEPDLDKMSVLFKKMIAVDSTDYRGYHGFAYAMYMRAIREENTELRNDFVYDAANNCITAYNLIITRFNVILDLGEIVRSINPDMAVDIHLRAKQLLEDPVVMSLEENRSTLGYKLLTFENNAYVFIPTLEQKQALVLYELALDYIADYRLNYEITSLIEHDELLKLATEYDKNGDIRLIYEDQRAVLDLFLPEE